MQMWCKGNQDHWLWMKILDREFNSQVIQVKLGKLLPSI